MSSGEAHSGTRPEQNHHRVAVVGTDRGGGDPGAPVGAQLLRRRQRLTSLKADPSRQLPRLAPAHLAYLKRSGLGFTHVRPAGFMQNLLISAGESGVLTYVLRYQPGEPARRRQARAPLGSTTTAHLSPRRRTSVDDRDRQGYVTAGGPDPDGQ
jgi:hypothetical protein